MSGCSLQNEIMKSNFEAGSEMALPFLLFYQPVFFTFQRIVILRNSRRKIQVFFGRELALTTAKSLEEHIAGPENAEAFQKYWAKENLPFIGLPDPEHKVLKLYGQKVKIFKLGRMPAQVMIDKSGYCDIRIAYPSVFFKSVFCDKVRLQRHLFFLIFVIIYTCYECDVMHGDGKK